MSPPNSPQESSAATSGSTRRPANWWSLLVLILVIWGGSQAWSWWRDRHSADLVHSLARPGDIVMYTTSTCPYCEVARGWLARHQVPWRECNIELNAACLAQYQSHGAPGTPLVNVKDQWRLGFDPVWLAQALQR
jgi:glutaredoxin